MNERGLSWALYFLNPFLSMVFALINYAKPYAKNIFWAFCTFYGFTFAIGTENSGSDINRYVEDLHFFATQSGFWIQDLVVFYNESGEVDLFNIILTFVVSKFSSSRSILVAIYAFFFGYFYSRNIWYVLSLLENRLNHLIRLLLFVFILIVPIWYINGIRMYLAFHVFFYGLLPYILENDRRKLIFVYLSFLIHFSYLIPITVFLSYRLIGNRLNMLFIIFLLSLFVSSFPISTINSNLGRIMPERILERTSAYRSEAAFQRKNESSTPQERRWYVKWHVLLMRWAIYILVTYLFLFGHADIKKNPIWRRLLSFTFLFLALGNFLMHVPSGARFMVFSYFLAILTIILYLDHFKQDQNFKSIVQGMTPAFLLFTIVAIRIGTYSFSITSIFGNPLVALFNMDQTISINDLIK